MDNMDVLQEIMEWVNNGVLRMHDKLERMHDKSEREHQWDIMRKKNERIKWIRHQQQKV